MRWCKAFCLYVSLVWTSSPVVWHVATPEQSFETIICNALDSAQQRVWVGLYRLTSSACVSALGRAQARGVDVRVLLDRGQTELPVHPSVLARLKAAGIAVWWLGPEPLMHNKMAIIDNRVFTGSVNWTRSGFFVNAENCVSFDEALVVQDYVTHFNTLLRRSAGFSEHTQTVSRQVFFVPDQKKELKKQLLEELHAARQSIDVAMYTCTVSWIWKALGVAAQRGVPVRVLLEPSQVCVASSLNDAIQKGVRVWTCSAPRGIMHHKLVCVDGVVWGGSMNLTPAGTGRHQENVVRIVDEVVRTEVGITLNALFKTARAYYCNAMPQKEGGRQKRLQ